MEDIVDYGGMDSLRGISPDSIHFQSLPLNYFFSFVYLSSYLR